MDDRMSVIVVDDEEGMREGIARILKKQGLEVDTAPDGESAIELVKNRMYDLAFVDLKMPGIDGFKVTNFINEKTEGRTVVVIVSALATVEAAVEVTRRGAFEFLVKPFTSADLLHAFKRAVSQRRLIQDRDTYLSELNGERSYSHQLINSMQEGVIVLNIQSTPVLMNPRAEYFMGKKYSSELTVGDLFHEKEIQNAVKNILSAGSRPSEHGKSDKDPLPRPGAIGQQSNHNGEMHFPVAGITRVFEVKRNDSMLQVRITPLLRDHTAGGAIIILHDFTDEWKAEQDKNRFVSMVAHELKSPLAAIINYFDVIQTGMFDKAPEKIHEIIGRCRIRGEALLELIQDLLYINSRETGKLEKSIGIIDLCGVISSQLEFYRAQLDNMGIEAKLTCKSSESLVRADKSDLDRIFMNLISNGIKYNRQNGKLLLTVERDNKHLVIEVQDTGIGMSKDEQENLFQEFYRVKNKKTGGISGTGLGLATVKRVLGEYNGRINVESEPDKGSTFTVTFPAA